jgi:hypothetical protein
MRSEKEKEADDVYSSGTKATHPGKLGDHPVGGAVGAVAGAVVGSAVAGASQGALAGTAAGVPGMAAGLAIGGVLGALAGKGAAQSINPTTEDEFWSRNYQTRDYVRPGETYDTYKSAYGHGVDSFNKHEGRPYDEVEHRVKEEWEARGSERMPWNKANPASRDAYERLYKRQTDVKIRDEDVDPVE